MPVPGVEGAARRNCRIDLGRRRVVLRQKRFQFAQHLDAGFGVGEMVIVAAQFDEAHVLAGLVQRPEHAPRLIDRDDEIVGAVDEQNGGAHTIGEIGGRDAAQRRAVFGAVADGDGANNRPSCSRRRLGPSVGAGIPEGPRVRRSWRRSGSDRASV